MPSRLFAFFLAVLTAFSAPQADASELWDEVRDIFESRCINCHAAHGAGKGLRLDSYAAARLGSEDGPVLIPGDPAKSELALRILGQSTPRMPFLGPPLPEDEVAAILRWIAAGLPE